MNKQLVKFILQNCVLLTISLSVNAETLPNHWIAETALAPFPAGTGPQWRPGWSDYASAAATGYCLARHPYVFGGETITGPSGTRYTKDGYELVGKPGIAGAIRRNFVYNRSSYNDDEGKLQTCANACQQFGQLYGGGGEPLKQLVGVTERTDGLGDISALALTDHAFYLDTPIIAGFSSRSNTFHESDVAEADMCCCQVTSP